MSLSVLPASAPLSAGPQSAAALDFEQATWQDAVRDFRMKGHKRERIDEFLKTFTTPQAVQQTCRDKARETSSQYGTVLSKILGKIDIFLAAGDIAVKGAPESVGLAWTGISLALHAVQDDWATFQVFSEACVDIIGILVNCRLFGRMFAYPREPLDFVEIQEKVRDSIPKVYGLILEFSYTMFKYMDRNRFLRVLRGVLKSHKEEFSGAMKGIKESERQMADSATKASQALTSYWQQRSDAKQTEMLGELSAIRSKLDESSAASKELNDYLKKELDEQRRKTPMDVARDAYTKNKKELKAIVDTEAMLQRRQKTREEGTCQWIFNIDPWVKWHDGEGSGLLWVSGGGNMGKSVLFSSIIDKLREELGPSSGRFFFFCKNGDDNAQKTDRILDHLLAYVYDLVPMALEPLASSNDVVRKYLATGGQGRSRKRAQLDKSDNEKSLTFSEAFTQLVEILKKEIYLVVDALDECNDREEEELIQTLCALAKRDDLKIKILLTSRRENDIVEAMDKTIANEVRMETYNEEDIKKTVESQLKAIPGMTSSERKIAHDKICHHAGSYFGYVQPALDLLRKPWQRPIEAHLQQLPNDVHNMQNKIFESTDPSYIGFLKTCLTWTILANGQQKMKINELIDIYSNKFSIDEEIVDGDEMEELNDEVTKFYKKQIRKTGDMFLDMDEKTRELNIVKPAIVKEAFLKPAENAEDARRKDQDPEDCNCKACRLGHEKTKSFVLTKKYGHLEIARQIFKHLNNPLFQKMYLSGPEPAEFAPSTAPSTMPHSPATVQQDVVESLAQPLADLALDSEGVQMSANSIADPDASPAHIAANGVGTSNFAQTEAMPQVEPEKEPDTTEGAQASPKNSPVPLRVDTDVGEANGIDADGEASQVVGQDSGTSQDGANGETPELAEADAIEDWASTADSDIDELEERDFVPYNAGSTHVEQPRYEISQAMHHLQMLQKEWADDEEKPQEYHELFQDVLKFFTPGSKAFVEWKIRVAGLPGPLLNEQPRLYEGLHIALAYGLVELSRKLIEDRGKQIVNPQEMEGSTPLHFAARLVDEPRKYDLCELLLSNGALPTLEALRNPDDGELRSEETPFHALIYSDQHDLRMVELFLEYGAKCDEIDPWGYGVMHDFGWSGKDPAILDLLVKNGADCNHGDRQGERPLHKLLRGKNEELPLEVLKGLLKHGADIKMVDEEGQDALFELAEGGNVEALKILLAHDPPPEINHVDNHKWTALHNAASYGMKDACEALVAAGADPACLEEDDKTPFFISIKSGNVATTEWNLDKLHEKHQGLIDACDKQGKTALRKSAGYGATEVVKLILSKYRSHVNIDAADKRLQWTPLHIAAYRGFSEIVQLLVDYGADLSLKDRKDRTPLEACYQQWDLCDIGGASDAEYEKCLDKLISGNRAAAVNDQHLLSTAAKRGSIPILEALVSGEPGQPKADPVRRDEVGWTAIQIAQSFKRQVAVDFLQSASGGQDKFPSSWKITQSDRSGYDATTGELVFTGEETGDATLDWNRRVTIFPDVPVPANISRYYFEISIEFPDPEKAAKDDHIVGIGVFQQPGIKNVKGIDTCFPGHFDSAKKGTLSWGFHGDDGVILASTQSYFTGDQIPKAERFGHGDTVGCGLDLEKGRIFFTKNGKMMPVEHEGVAGRLYPVVGLQKKCKVKTAFQKPFKWRWGDDLDFEKGTEEYQRQQEEKEREAAEAYRQTMMDLVHIPEGPELEEVKKLDAAEAQGGAERLRDKPGIDVAVP